MPFISFIKDPAQIIRIIITLLFTIGSALTAFNLFAFRVDKYGLYYRDDAQFWLAIGISALVLGWFIKNWQKI